MDEVRAISSELEGAELRREKGKNRYFTRTSGNNDNEQLNEALHHNQHNLFIPRSIWERIFGGKS
ncbi:MAG: hypothetical protein PHU23_00170 [Dehalococcoidales bacterium]|nr:hypothetical protein [Dehalococcoidales bacterium]